jgi:nitroreductase
MRKILRKILPQWMKDIYHRLIGIPDIILTQTFKSLPFMASVYYAVLNRKFGREHKAVLEGKHAYHKTLYKPGKSSILLRRNIHRLEKGLIMEPRRDVFGEAYIREVVEIYKQALLYGNLQTDEKKWITDVLVEYFSTVKDTDIIAGARALFESCVEEDNLPIKYVPYSYKSMSKTDITYEQLHRLFIQRRSVRWYRDKDVPMDLIEKAVDIATLAPSACNRQPYSFYISQGRKNAVEIAKCAGGTGGWADGIPCTIVVVGDLSAYYRERDRHLIYIDGSLAAMQLMLAFETLGLSTCPINWPDIEDAEKKLSSLLGLRSFERAVMLISVGYALESGRIPFSQKKPSSFLIKKV